MTESTDTGPNFLVEVDSLRTIEALEKRTHSNRFLRFNPHFTHFRNGIELCVDLVHHLGDIPPKDDTDKTLRDLACDTLDSLWIAERALLGGYDNQALVLLRRAYEATSLMTYFLNFPERVADWNKSTIIRQSGIRRALDAAPMREPKKNLDEMYRVYSLFSHINRDTVYHRMLGEENRLTLGCQGNVGDETVGSLVRELLIQMMWFVDVFNYAYKEVGVKLEKKYRDDVVAYRGQVQNLARGLRPLY